MSVTLYVSRLQEIGDALAAHIALAPVLAAESCEVVSRVDDTIATMIEQRVAKAGGLLAIVALEEVSPSQVGAPGPRVRATWNLSLWARRAMRSQKNAGPVLFEAMLARVQNWKPTGALCYDEFSLVRGSHVPHPTFSLYEASFAAQVTLGDPVEE
jgi:hypothetical protein